jgi:integrase
MSSDMHNFYKDKPWDFDRDETMRIFTLYLHTGCRLNELLTLTWDNVHFEEKSITVIGKRKKVRKIFITETAMQILMSMTDRKQPMPYTEYKVRSRLNDLNKISGIKFTTHNLRSTCGSFMLSSGASIEEVSSHLGHEDIQTTWKWYARIIEEKRKSATLKMEKLTMGLPNYIVTLQDKTLA